MSWITSKSTSMPLLKSHSNIQAKGFKKKKNLRQVKTILIVMLALPKPNNEASKRQRSKQPNVHFWYG